jgi:uncharacterized protein (TIGR02145 family)
MVRVYDTTWNANIVYGYLTDARDLQTYRTVQIGTQAWMAQNLNFKGLGVDSGWVQDNQPDSALKYGRLYMWTSVVASDTCKLWKQCTIKVVQPHRGICPAGWHVPSDGEWKSLEVAIGMSATVAESLQYRGMTEGTKLKSAGGGRAFRVGTFMDFGSYPEAYTLEVRPPTRGTWPISGWLPITTRTTPGSEGSFSATRW